MSCDVEDSGRELNEALDRLIRRAGLPRVHQRLNAAAGVRLDRSSYWLASWLTDTESLRLSDLAEVLHTDLSTVSRQVQAAERAGLVERRPDPSDGRASRVYLTRGGRDALERLRAVQRAEILASIADWLPQDQQRFAELMSRFARSFLAWAVDDFSARPAG
ncbi:MAG TPA: MarR family transcriptional regulator [Chloroflexota bacterium]|jgi:DNA-binding MarR family transcriptional regulator